MLRFDLLLGSDRGQYDHRAVQALPSSPEGCARSRPRPSVGAPELSQVFEITPATPATVVRTESLGLMQVLGDLRRSTETPGQPVRVEPFAKAMTPISTRRCIVAMSSRGSTAPLRRVPTLVFPSVALSISNSKVERITSRPVR